MPSLKQSTSEANSRLRKIEKLILEYLPQYKEGQLLKWLRWADPQGFVISVWPDEREQEVLAAAIVRPISPEQFQAGYNSFVSDEQGPILFIDIAVAPTKQAFQALSFAVRQRFGRRYFIAFHSKGKEKLHRYRRAEKAIFKLK